MSKVNFENLLAAGVHFGHLKRKWNPAMAPYIFDEQKGIHIIDLNKTIAQLDQASAAIKQIAKSGKKILFVATKKQAKDIVAERVAAINMPYVTERWSGGMLTNFQTTRKSIRKMSNIDKMKVDGTWTTLNKRERLFKDRQRDKLEKNFGSIADMTRQPAALFIVDILKEHIAVAEARKLNIPIFGICLGHQLLGLALGLKTEKMKFGHHGAHHPVQNVLDKTVSITSQNHGFTISEESLNDKVIVTHRSLFDKSIQGISSGDGRDPLYRFIKQ
jgi:small subunit ribosomal protein S2